MSRLALLVIRLATPPADREWVLGDTIEEYEAHARADGPSAAHFWLLREALRVVAWAPRHRRAIGRARRGLSGTDLMRFLDDLRQDLRYSVRVLLQVPAFSFVVVLTLALGIGANTAIFSVVNALLLTPLPYKDPDRLVRLVENVPAEESPNGRAVRLSTIQQEDFLAWREQSRTLSHMAIYSSPVAMTLSGRGEAVRLNGRRVSPALFAMLGMPPIMGQFFDEHDAAPGANPRIVLSHRAWQRYFAADRNVLTASLILDGRSYAVIGITRPDFEFPDPQTEFWAPLMPTDVPSTGVTRVQMIARLVDGASLESATAEANVIGGRLRGDPASAESGRQ
jgi:putative ABC transport system permease protein